MVLSAGKLRLTAAPESQGTPNDGVVVVNLGLSTAFWPKGPADDGRRGRRIVEAVDPYVNFAGFDRNGDGKVEAMRRCAEKHEIDMDASWAYSDSVSDLPMLRSVGHAVVVNPDGDLLEVARQEGWQVMRFERLGRRLAIAGATAVAAAAGGIAAGASKRRNSSRFRAARGALRR